MRPALWALGVILGLAILLRLLASGIPGARVSSWWRSPWRNVLAGGKRWSMHLIGWAVDLVPVTPRIEAAARRIFPFVYNEGDHLHAGWVA